MTKKCGCWIEGMRTDTEVCQCLKERDRIVLILTSLSVLQQTETKREKDEGEEINMTRFSTSF